MLFLNNEFLVTHHTASCIHKDIWILFKLPLWLFANHFYLGRHFLLYADFTLNSSKHESLKQDPMIIMKRVWRIKENLFLEKCSLLSLQGGPWIRSIVCHATLMTSAFSKQFTLNMRQRKPIWLKETNTISCYHFSIY